MSKHCLGIIGTDTDVGKTLFTALLAKELQVNNKEALIIKAVQTGCLESDSTKEFIVPDIAKYKDIENSLIADSFYRLLAACSPHLAFEKEGKILSARSLASEIIDKVNASHQDICLIEGSGGLMTPINYRESFADLFFILSESLKLSLIMVIDNKLGALNHALLTYERLKALNLYLLGFVMNETKTNNNANSLEDEIKTNNIKYLEQHFGCKYLGALPYSKDVHSQDYSRRQHGYKELATCIKVSKILNII